MARSSLRITLDQKRPALNLSDPNPKAGRQLLRKVIRHLEGVLGGAVDASHILFEVDGAQPVAASGTGTMAAVAAADTISLNGVAQTATELRANCTITVGTSVDNNDTVTVNGKVFTAKTADPGTDEFLVTGVAATDAAALVTCINATTSPLVSGIIEAVRPAADGVVNIYAIAIGTAGNSYTIATSDAVDLAITNDDSGSFAGGAAAATDQFDPIGNNIRTATDLVRSIGASTTALIAKHVEASNWAGSVTLSTCTAGTKLLIGMHEFTAVATAANVLNPGDFSISGTDTQDAAALVTAINTHPVLSHQVVASNSSGVVTIRCRRATSAPWVMSVGGSSPSGLSITTQFVATAVVLFSAKAEGQTGNGITLASSNGTRLAVSAARLAGGTGSDSGTLVRMVLGGSSN